MKKMQKILSVILTLCVCLMMVVPFYVNAATVVTINTAYDLMMASYSPDKDYVLGADIILTPKQFESGGQFYLKGNGFPVIGTQTKPFSGTFDGNGYKIQGIKISHTSDQYVGLFGYVTGTVKNVALVDAQVTGGYYTGGIAGYVAQGGKVTQCYTSGGTIKSEYTGGNFRLGGLVGYIAQNADVSNSYNTANVVLPAGKAGYVAGIAGECRGTINMCYNAAVFGENVKYGVMALGESYYAGNTYTINCVEYAAPQDKTLGLHFVPSMWRSDAQLRTQSSMTGFDFTNVWKYDTSTGYPYPVLRATVHKMTKGSSGSFPSGTGTVFDPYTISTAAQFAMIANDTNACYKLTANITLADSYTPISSLRGILYGNGKTIKASAPLFSENLGRIENLTVASSLSSSTNTGAIAVKNSNVISDCKVSGNVSGANVGGVCYENTGRIINTTVSASVTAKTGAAAGFAALNSGFVGEGSSNTGAVEGKVNAGGITAENTKTGVITKTTNFGTVKASGYAGGIAAKNVGDIQRTANYGAVTATGNSSAAGGIAGKNENKVYESQNTAIITSDVNAGGIVGENRSSSVNVLNTGNVFAGQAAGGIAGINKYADNGAKAQVAYSITYGNAFSEKGAAAVVVGQNVGDAVITYSTFLPTSQASYTGDSRYVSSVLSLTREQFAEPENYMGLFDFPAIWSDEAPLPTLTFFPYKAVTGIRFGSSSTEGKTGDTIILEPEFQPKDATIPDIEWSSSNGNVATVNSAGVVSLVNPGTATITATSNGSKASVIISVKQSSTKVERIAGSDRLQTAIKICNKGWTTADTVVLANALNYADALAGVPYAALLDAPILLTNGKSLEPEVADKIRDVKAKKVVILGGAGVISSAIANELKKTVTVERICGSDRYGTSAQIAKKFPSTASVIVTTGMNYADALSISPYASIKKMPILYCDPAAGLSESINKIVGSAKNVIVVGGAGVIPGKFIPTTFTRVAGLNRYATSYEIARRYSSEFGNNVTIATGTNFPDALAGGVLCAKLKTPLLLTDTNGLITEMKDYINTKSPSTIYILGGAGVVPQRIINEVL